MVYFPDHNLKKPPPSKYFWKVVQQTHPKEYQVALDFHKERLKKNQKQLQTMNLTEEALQIMNEFDPNELSLMLKRSHQSLKRPTVILRQTRQRQPPNQIPFIPSAETNPGANQEPPSERLNQNKILQEAKGKDQEWGNQVETKIQNQINQYFKNGSS